MVKKLSYFFLVLLFSFFLVPVQATNRDYIQIVGSSTIYPFATVVAERFGQTTRYKTPKIESTGSGGGFKLFCAGVGVGHPDITNASRAIKKSEAANCKKHGIEPIEFIIGYDGIVLANANNAPVFNFTRRDIYLALAKEVPNPDGSETFIPNPYTNWDEVNEKLPHKNIEVLGPPPTSGTRDAFVELAMEEGADTFDWVAALKKSNKKLFKAATHGIREDGHYIEAGENDNLIVQKLVSNHAALGIFGFSYLDQNSDLIKGSLVGSIPPEFETIATGLYVLSRPLFFYVKKQHLGSIPGMDEYIKAFISDNAIGPDGYLLDRGLIYLPDKFRLLNRNKLRDL